MAGKGLWLQSIVLGVVLLMATGAGYAFDGNDVLKVKTTKRCRSCDLYAADLAGANLAGADLNGANLAAAAFRAPTSRARTCSMLTFRAPISRAQTSRLQSSPTRSSPVPTSIARGSPVPYGRTAVRADPAP